MPASVINRPTEGQQPSEAKESPRSMHGSLLPPTDDTVFTDAARKHGHRGEEAEGFFDDTLQVT